MSKYTTQLRFPVEQKLNDLHLALDEENWFHVYSMLGLDDYPIFEEQHRDVLNRKILRRYWFREIGFETLGQFAWMMRRTMYEIMPYYNQLYESELLVTEPMYTVHKNYEESWNRSNEQETKNTATAGSDVNSTSANRNVYQDTPMNGLDTGAIEGMDYATNVTFDDGSGKTTTNSTSNANGTRGENDNGWRVHEEKGYDKSQSNLLKEYRDTFLNIDLEIVDRLNDLFIGLW